MSLLMHSLTLSAAQKTKRGYCGFDLDAAYETGGKLIKRALDDAR